jgi:membrane protein
VKKYLGLFRQTLTEFGEDKAPRLGAALAYYTIFSIGPLLLIAVAVAGLAFGQEAAQGQLSAQLRGVLGPNAASALETMVENAAKPKTGAFATILGILMLLLGASGIVGQLKDALNTIWNVEPKKGGGILNMIKERFLSVAAVLAGGFLLMVTLIFDAVISAMGDYMTRMMGGEAILQAIQLIVSFALVTLLFALIFRYMPDIRVSWHDVWFGAVFTAILFVIGKFALGLYLGKAAVGSSYGAAGSLVVLLLWVYYSAQILFFGAEFTQVYARTAGSLKDEGPESAAVPVVQERPARAERPARSSSLAALGMTGIAGLMVGTIVGGLTASVIAMKSVKKVLSLPFK